MEELIGGVVTKSTGSWYAVRIASGQIVNCRIKGKFRIKGIKTTNPLAVGDEVKLSIDTDGNGVISEIEPRTNYIIRRSVNLSKQTHIIASNLSQAMLVVTLENPHTSTGFIDRFLITCEAYHIPVILVFNKVDLLSADQLNKLKEIEGVYNSCGYSSLRTSAVQGLNLDKFKSLLQDKTTLLSGHSGAGKSSLINQVDSSLNLKTGAISDAHFKGKHTTTFSEMFPLSFGGDIIDTPGIKGFGLVDFEKFELAGYYPEMRALLPECKFHNCLHVNEPNCAVKQAVEIGSISNFRYKSYMAMYRDEAEEHYRTVDY